MGSEPVDSGPSSTCVSSGSASGSVSLFASLSLSMKWELVSSRNEKDHGSERTSCYTVRSQRVLHRLGLQVE